MSNRFIGARQTTIAQDIKVNGTGFTAERRFRSSCIRQPPILGSVSWSRSAARVTADIPAKTCNVKNLTLCTVIGDEDGATVSTVEHLLAALRGLQIDNCVIEIDSKEVPIMDGSSAPFVEAIDRGRHPRALRLRAAILKVLKTIRVEEGECWGELSPHSGFHLDVEIDFPSPIIGQQRLSPSR